VRDPGAGVVKIRTQIILEIRATQSALKKEIARLSAT
jgi:hypothetical protein